MDSTKHWKVRFTSNISHMGSLWYVTDLLSELLCRPPTSDSPCRLVRFGSDLHENQETFADWLGFLNCMMVSYFSTLRKPATRYWKYWKPLMLSSEPWRSFRPQPLWQDENARVHQTCASLATSVYFYRDVSTCRRRRGHLKLVI